MQPEEGRISEKEEADPLPDHAALAPSRTRSDAAPGSIGGLIDP